MSEFNFDEVVSLQTAGKFLRTQGQHNTYLFQGSPGIGKSSLLNQFKSDDNYICAYIDCANMDLGDLAMPVVDKEHMELNWAPNARFQIRKAKETGKRLVIMLDELGKTLPPIMNMLLPVLQEHRLGDVGFPEGTITFGTSNLASDGVGDKVPPHAYNRMTVMQVRSPNSEEWSSWALQNGIEPELMSFVSNYKDVLRPYSEGSEGAVNKYCFDPKRGNIKTFCSPRSLAKSSPAIAAFKSGVYNESELYANLLGTIGKAGASDLMGLVQLGVNLPTIEEIIADPGKSAKRIEDSPQAHFLVAANAAGCINEKTVEPLSTFVADHMQPEAMCYFGTLVVNNQKLSKFLIHSPTFMKRISKELIGLLKM